MSKTRQRSTSSQSRRQPSSRRTSSTRTQPGRSRRQPPVRRAPKQTFTILSLVGIVVVAIVLAATTQWHPYWIWLVAASLVTFALYGFDKAQAQRQGARVPEVVLHGLALAGGFVGGWVGRAFFRHKTRKRIFAIVLAVSTLLHLIIIYVTFLR